MVVAWGRGFVRRKEEGVRRSDEEASVFMEFCVSGFCIAKVQAARGEARQQAEI